MTPGHYYIALLTDEELNQEIEAFKVYLRNRFGAAAALKSPAHITLVAPFWMPREQAPELEQQLDQFAAGQQPLFLQTDTFDHFGKKVLYVSLKASAGLEQLQQDLLKFLLRLPWWPGKADDRPFHPHITLATRDLQPSDFEKAWAHFHRRSFSRPILAEALHLMHRGTQNWEPVHQSAFSPVS